MPRPIRYDFLELGLHCHCCSHDVSFFTQKQSISPLLRRKLWTSYENSPFGQTLSFYMDLDNMDCVEII